MGFSETEFSGGSRISQTGRGTQLERRTKFPENCMKMKKIGPRGGCPKFYYVDTPLELHHNSWIDVV